MIIIESKRKKAATILKMYPDAILADVTSGAKDGLVKVNGNLCGKQIIPLLRMVGIWAFARC